MSDQQPAVIVVGSLNMDLNVLVPRLPQRGETVSGRDFVPLPGGKGANQACAAGQLSTEQIRVAMVGSVGRDANGQALIESLHAASVDTKFVRAVEAAPTGIALIVIEDGGQNQIVVAAGANESVSPSEVAEALESLRGSHLLLQLETPLDAVEAAAAHGRSMGMTVILDPAPARSLPASILQHIDILTPNESEALALLDLPGNHISLIDAPWIAKRLSALGPRRILLKLGAQGAFLFEEDNHHHFPAPPVHAIDTTAAGDCFNGALAVGLAEGLPINEAIAFAVRAASISVTRLGAQASLPNRDEVVWNE